MTGRFPLTPTFTGFNAPMRMEADVRDLEVEGALPAGLEGSFYRCGPDFSFPPLMVDDINHNGDGVVSMFRFQDGRVDFSMRFVRTERYELEHRAGRALFGMYRNPFTDDPSVAGKDRTLANTNVVFHGGRLLALKEDGLPYEVDPDTLATRGRWDFAGRLKSETFTAHPKIDPVSGEMIAFGYEAAGLASKTMSLQVIGKDGTLAREEFFEAPYVSFQHDFSVTQDHIVFTLMPTTTSIERMKAGNTHWVFDQSLPIEVGIMPRDGSVKELRWFKAPGRGVGHMLNAFTDGSKVYLDTFVSERNQFPFVPNADGTAFDRRAGTPRLTRWTFDLGSNSEGFEEETLFPDFMEMPRTDDRYQTDALPLGLLRHHRHEPSAGHSRHAGARVEHPLPRGHGRADHGPLVGRARHRLPGAAVRPAFGRRAGRGRLAAVRAHAAEGRRLFKRAGDPGRPELWATGRSRRSGCPSA